MFHFMQALASLSGAEDRVRVPCGAEEREEGSAIHPRTALLSNGTAPPERRLIYRRRRRSLYSTLDGMVLEKDEVVDTATTENSTGGITWVCRAKQ